MKDAVVRGSERSLLILPFSQGNREQGPWLSAEGRGWDKGRGETIL